MTQFQSAEFATSTYPHCSSTLFPACRSSSHGDPRRAGPLREGGQQRGAPLYRARSLGAAHVHHVVPRRRAAGGRLPAPPHATGSQPAGGLRRRTEHGKCTVDTYLLFTYVDHNIFEFLINSIKLN